MKKPFFLYFQALGSSESEAGPEIGQASPKTSLAQCLKNLPCTAVSIDAILLYIIIFLLLL